MNKANHIQRQEMARLEASSGARSRADLQPFHSTWSTKGHRYLDLVVAPTARRARAGEMRREMRRCRKLFSWYVRSVFGWKLCSSISAVERFCRNRSVIPWKGVSRQDCATPKRCLTSSI